MVTRISWCRFTRRKASSNVARQSVRPANSLSEKAKIMAGLNWPKTLRSLRTGSMRICVISNRNSDGIDRGKPMPIAPGVFSTQASPTDSIWSMSSMPTEKVPDDRGHFGLYGGRYVPETLMHPLQELEEEYLRSQND